MVEAEILAGSDGRLIPSKVEPDVDHRDIVVAGLGSFGALWLQVKGATHLDKEGRVIATATFPIGAVPKSDRLYYVVCMVDLGAHELARLWLVPSVDFNRLANHDHPHRPGHVTLQFSCLASGDERWGPFEVPRLQFASRLELIVAALGPTTAEEFSALRAQISSGLGSSVEGSAEA